MSESRNNEQKKESKNILKCPNCNGVLTFLMPDGKKLYCNKCEKYYVNDNGKVGKETSTPYTRNNVLY